MLAVVTVVGRRQEHLTFCRGTDCKLAFVTGANAAAIIHDLRSLVAVLSQCTNMCGQKATYLHLFEPDSERDRLCLLYPDDGVRHAASARLTSA